MKKLLLIIVILLGLNGCGRALIGAQTAASSGIRTWLDQPLDGSSQLVEPTLLKAHARNEIGGGINSIAFVVNGTAVGTVATDASAAIVAAELAWTPSVPGEYIVQAQAFSGDRSTISAAARVCVGKQITAALSDGTCGPTPATAVSVALATARPSATAIKTSTATASPTASPSATATASPSATATAAPVATAVPQLPSATPIPLEPTFTPTRFVPSATPTTNIVVPTVTSSPTAVQPSVTPLPPSVTPTVFRDTDPPVLVGSIDTSPLITYHGPCQQGEPGILSVALIASDASGIGDATLSYTFLSSRGGALGGSAVTMDQSPADGGTLLSAAVNVAREAPQYLGGNNGLITYRLDLSDTVGNSAQIQGANFEVRACQPPTVTPTQIPKDSTPPTFGKIYATPDPVFYGTCSQPTRTTLVAEVSDDSGVGSVTLIYRYRSESTRIPPGAWTTLTLDGGQGVYSAVVNVGGEAYATLQGTNGFLEYQVTASDSVGNTSQSGVAVASVIYCIG
jgi:hypothetical protein